jgi:hypothetical protein
LLNGTRALKADLRRLQRGAANERSGQRGRRDRPHRAKAIAR